MKKGNPITMGLMIGTGLGIAAGIAMPETRSEPMAIVIVAVCGAIAGTGIGFAVGLVRRTDEEREQGTGLEELSEAASGRGGIGFGILIVAIAIIWFVAGLLANRVYFYPPILLILGVISIVRGMAGQAGSTETSEQTGPPEPADARESPS